MKTIHIFLHPSSNIGLSLCAGMLSEYLLDTAAQPLCIDGNMQNPTLSQYYTLKASQLDLHQTFETEEKIIAFINRMSQYPGDIIIDTESNAFNLITSSLTSTYFIETIRKLKTSIILHTIIVGDNRFTQSVKGVNMLANCVTDNIKICLWLNGHYGPIECEGEDFESSTAYIEIKDKINNIITLPYSDDFYFNQDHQLSINNALTMDEAIRSSRTFIFTKQRLTMIKRETFQQINNFGVA